LKRKILLSIKYPIAPLAAYNVKKMEAIINAIIIIIKKKITQPMVQGNRWLKTLHECFTSDMFSSSKLPVI